jgi:hypothetical protein
VKVWRVAFLARLAMCGEEQRAADEVGISDRRVRQLKRADPGFAAQVAAAKQRVMIAQQIEFLEVQLAELRRRRAS